MPHFLNTAGPTNAKDHYCLSSLTRLKLDEVLPLIEQKKYFGFMRHGKSAKPPVCWR